MKRAAFIGAAVMALIIGVSAQSSARNKPATLKITVMVDGMDGDATEAGFQSPGWNHAHFGRNAYKASDGQTLSATYLQLRDEDEAHRYFDWSLGRAIRVTDKGSKQDNQGRTVGRRAEVVPKSRVGGCGVMWTDGAMFREIVADDCDHARALEKQYIP